MISLFVSYSHKDKEHREHLESHLSLLKRAGLINTWSDRQIRAGQDWKLEINDSLNHSDVVIFLVSSDFLASDYCFDVEVQSAIRRHNAKEAVVIPVIVRPCDWTSSVLGNIQSLPSGVNPITKWDNIDEAWLSVVEGIKDTIALIDTRKKLGGHRESEWHSDLTKKFQEWLDDSEVELVHRHLDHVRLSDIFIYQDLRILDLDKSDTIKTANSSDPRFLDGWNLILGEEQSGKTSLAKRLFANSIRSGGSPVLIGGKNIKSSDIEKVIGPALVEQYQECAIDLYFQQPDRLLIIDDYTQNNNQSDLPDCIYRTSKEGILVNYHYCR